MRPTKMWVQSRLSRARPVSSGRMARQRRRGRNISDWYRMIGGLYIETIGSVPLKWILDAEDPRPATWLRGW
jgi:hypothetical protein